VSELMAVAPGRDTDVSDAATFARVELTEDIHAAPNPAGTTVDRLVAHGVGQTLHRMAGLDRVSVEVQLAMDLDQRHRPTVARKHRQTTGPQVATPQRMCVRRHWRNRRRSTPMRDPEPVNDVLRFDARPHHHT
jgi:hypothetical protein